MTDKPHSVVRDVLSRLRRAERSLLRRGKAGGSRWLRRDLIFPTGREEICRGLAVGMFWACAPMPMQMVPALLFCWLVVKFFCNHSRNAGMPRSRYTPELARSETDTKPILKTSLIVW